MDPTAFPFKGGLKITRVSRYNDNYCFDINCLFFSPCLRADGDRLDVDVSGGERIVAATGRAQLPGWLRPVVQTVAVQRHRGRSAVGGEHHRVRRLTAFEFTFFSRTYRRKPLSSFSLHVPSQPLESLTTNTILRKRSDQTTVSV